jgi:hypothetical protein
LVWVAGGVWVVSVLCANAIGAAHKPVSISARIETRIEASRRLERLRAGDAGPVARSARIFRLEPYCGPGAIRWPGTRAVKMRLPRKRVMGKDLAHSGREGGNDCARDATLEIALGGKHLEHSRVRH